MPRRHSRARQFQIYVVPTVGGIPAAGVGALLVGSPLGPPEGLASPTVSAVVGAAIVIGVVAATGVLLWAPRTAPGVRLGVVIVVAGLFGASAVLASTLTPAGVAAWLMALVWLLFALGVVLAGVTSTITSPGHRPHSPDSRAENEGRPAEHQAMRH